MQKRKYLLSYEKEIDMQPVQQNFPLACPVFKEDPQPSWMGCVQRCFSYLASFFDRTPFLERVERSGALIGFQLAQFNLNGTWKKTYREDGTIYTHLPRHESVRIFQYINRSLTSHLQKTPLEGWASLINQVKTHHSPLFLGAVVSGNFEVIIRADDPQKIRQDILESVKMDEYFFAIYYALRVGNLEVVEPLVRNMPHYYRETMKLILDQLALFAEGYNQLHCVQFLKKLKIEFLTQLSEEEGGEPIDQKEEAL